MTDAKAKQSAFIRWFPYDKRNEAIALGVGAECFFINVLKTRKVWNAPIRYLLSFFYTIMVLIRHKPKIIFVTNPPIFAAIPVALFSAVYGARFIIDSHSGAFDNKWRLFEPIHRYLSCSALLNMVTNENHRRIYTSWGAKSFILSDLVQHIPISKGTILGDNFKCFIWIRTTILKK